MSVPEPKRTPAKQKQKDPRPRPPAHGTERLKIIVRRLPPNLPEDIFWQSVQPWVKDDSVTWKVYHAGKLRKRPNQENVPSRAYVAFKNEEILATFGREYDGHLFRDKAGNEFQAVVEFAPFQKVPPEKRKPDARNATIDKDEDYISFLETLKNSGTAEHASLESLIVAAQPSAMPTTTPLLEALKAAKSAQKDKEAIIRNHAHYKDSSITSAARKEEAKKKSVAAIAIPQKQPEARPAPLSRKARKAAAAEAQKAAAAQKAKSPAQTAQVTAPAEKGVSTGNANTPANPQASGSRSTPRSPRSARHQAPKVSTASAPLAPKPATQSVPSTNTEAPSPAPSAGNRKGRPVIGLGRHFEAALNGAVGPGGGKKRENESNPDPANEVVQKDVAGKSNDTSSTRVTPSPGPGVPNILKRVEGHAPRVAEGSAAVDSHAGRGGPRRGRGRGRGASRGG